MASFFGFASAPVDVEIRLNGEDDRKQVEAKGDQDKKELCPVFYDGESVEGKVRYRWTKVLTAVHTDSRLSSA